jgi:hypothetical protein
LVRPHSLPALVLGTAVIPNDGALIYLTFARRREDVRHYFRTLPRFETNASNYAFLNRLLAVGLGEIPAEGPVHIIEEIL